MRGRMYQGALLDDQEASIAKRQLMPAIQEYVRKRDRLARLERQRRFMHGVRIASWIALGAAGAIAFCVLLVQALAWCGVGSVLG